MLNQCLASIIDDYRDNTSWLALAAPSGIDSAHSHSAMINNADQMEIGVMDKSLAVENPEIVEVQNMETGELVPAHHAIGADYGKAMALRMGLRQSIAESSPLYICPICGVPVYLVSRKEERKFFFRHDLEDGRCPARTRGELSEKEINARKYNGAKESQAHIRMKEIIAESLRCDPRFSEVKIESVLKSQDRAAWRKPDVQAIYDGIQVAFEIQLSTTFLRVIAERNTIRTAGSMRSRPFFFLRCAPRRHSRPAMVYRWKSPAISIVVWRWSGLNRREWSTAELPE